MENEPIRQFKTGFGIFGRMFVYKDRLVIKKLLGSKTIPLSKIANIEYSKIMSGVYIETSGGEKTLVQFGAFSGMSGKDKQEAYEFLSSLIST